MDWTPNKVTALRVLVGFSAVALFGHGTWVNLAAVLLTVAAIALDALDGHLARKKQMATPLGAQLDILGDRMIENISPLSEWFRYGFQSYFSRVARQRIFCAAWHSKPGTPAGERTLCCNRGGDGRWSLRAGAAGFTPRSNAPASATSDSSWR